MCRQCFSQPSQAVHHASSCRSISVPRQRRVLYQCLFRLALWGDLLLSQFKSIVNMIYGDVSYLQTGSSIFPSDELVPSAHVTAVCFLRWTIFIHANKLNLPCFCGRYFSPPLPLLFPHVWPFTRQLPETWDWHRGTSLAEQFETSFFSSPSEAPIWVITGFLMAVRCRNI